MGRIKTGSDMYFIAFAEFAAPYKFHVPTCCASLTRVSLNLAEYLVVTREKVTFSSPDVVAVNLSLGTTAVLPPDACAPWRCRSHHAFPILSSCFTYSTLLPNNVDETLFQCVFKYQYTLDLDYLAKVSSISSLHTYIYKASGTESLDTVSQYHSSWTY